MPNSNITSHRYNPVTLGAGGYADQIAVADTASVIVAAFGATAIYGAVADGFINNDGTIIGGEAGDSGGGVGVKLEAGAIHNDGSIGGGGGGGGFGGDGVVLSNAYLYNHSGATITGGGGASNDLPGYGVFATSSTIVNFGTIIGGAAAASALPTEINGAAAVYLNVGTLHDFGSLIGGAAGADGGITGTQGDAVQFGINNATLFVDGLATFSGAVVANSARVDVLYLDNSTGTFTGLGTQFIDFQQVRIEGSSNWTIAGANTIASDEQLLFAPTASLTITGTLKNLGSMIGGTGSDGLDGSSGGSGGAAAYLVLNSGTVINGSSITGGAGGNSQNGVGSSGGSGGAGGAGIDLFAGSGGASNAGVLMSYAFDLHVVQGGAGGNGSFATGSGGTGGTGGIGVSLNGVMLTNSADIMGGAGGTGGDSGVSSGHGGSGGTGIVLTAATLGNSATITGGGGGAGGYGGAHRFGGAGGSGVLMNSGSLTNSGTLLGGYGGYGAPGGAALLLQAGNAVNTGLIFGGGSGFGGGAGGSGVQLASGTLTNFGTIQASAGGLDLATSTRGPSGDAVQFGAGVGTLVAMPGAMFLGNVAANPAEPDVLELGSASGVGTLTGIGGEFTGFSTLQFDNGAHWSVQGTSTALQPIDITGFQRSDSIDVAGIGIAKSAETIGHAVVLFSGTADTSTELFMFNTLTGVGGATLNPGTLTLASDGSGGTTVSIACYCRGTHIATPAGETPIEALRIGDLVRTHEGRSVPVRWIGRRDYARPFVAANQQLRPVRVRAGALGEGAPSRDLLVSPQHALLVDGVLIPAAALVNGTSITREPAGEVSYLHLELDRHDLIIAEGAPAETFVDDHSRGMFQNAAEYFFQCPNGPATDPAFRLPRVEDGPMLHAIRRRLAGTVAARPPGRLEGHVERIVDGVVEGWALDRGNPGEPVLLDLWAGAAAPVRVIANRYRTDLDRAGLAGGRCGFRHPVPPGSAPIHVTRASDGALLPGPIEPAVPAPMPRGSGSSKRPRRANRA